MIRLNKKIITFGFPHGTLYQRLKDKRSKCIILISLLLTSFFVNAQKKVEILNAGSLKVANNIAEGAKRLVGDVQFKHENALMFCDSAYFYSDNSLDAFGHVHIQQADGVNLYGDLLKYNGNEKMAVLTNNVTVDKGDMQLTTDVLNYDIAAGTGFYNTPGRIVNKDNVLTSERGTYYSKTNDVSFKKNVVLTNPQFVINCDTMHYNTVSKMTYFLGPTTIKSKENLIYCEDGWYDTNNDISRFSKNAYILNKEQKMFGDSLYYDRKQGVGKAFGNVVIIDTAQNVTIGGDYAIRYDLTDIAYVTGHALLTQRYDKDTLYLHADTLKAVGDNIPKDTLRQKAIVQETKGKNKDSKNKSKNKKQKSKEEEIHTTTQTIHSASPTSEGKKLYAYHKVKFFKSDMQGKCDSLVYVMSDSMMRLYNKPVIWSEESQLTGDSIRLQTGGKAIQSIELTTGGFIASQEDSLRYNQIKGRYIKGFFRKNDLYLIKVEGNGQTIYYAKDKDKLTAVNRADCSNLNIYMKENKIDHITFITKPDATLYPLNQVDVKELKLKDFGWRGKERPRLLADIFTW
jgi:lipopolysaccharide export system protein LptA